MKKFISLLLVIAFYQVQAQKIQEVEQFKSIDIDLFQNLDIVELSYTTTGFNDYILLLKIEATSEAVRQVPVFEFNLPALEPAPLFISKEQPFDQYCMKE